MAQTLLSAASEEEKQVGWLSAVCGAFGCLLVWFWLASGVHFVGSFQGNFEKQTWMMWHLQTQNVALKRAPLFRGYVEVFLAMRFSAISGIMDLVENILGVHMILQRFHKF